MNELKRIINLLNKISELEKYKKMWETLTKKLEGREMVGKDYGITFILHLMQEIEKELKNESK